MIILPLLYLAASRRHNVEAFPLGALEANYLNDSISSLHPRHSFTFSDRSIYHIVWSCFSTIFACTWIAVHPNIPSPSDRPWQVLGRRIAIMGYLLVAPEVVILWASRQYLGAWKIAKKHKDRGWTKTHAYFMIMGGFSLHQDGQFLRTLDIVELEELSAAGKIEWPTLTEVEIEDKSKGDVFAKGVVVLQTLWFVAQCIARGRNNLVVTELEVVTLAFAALTSLIYFLWWNKPLDVRCAVQVHLKVKIQPDDESEDDSDEPSPPAMPPPHPENNTQVAEPPIDAPIPACHPDVVHDEHSLGAHDASVLPTKETIPDEDTQNDSPTDGLKKLRTEHGTFIAVLYAIFVLPFLSFFSSMDDMFHCKTMGRDHSRVPTFYSPDIGDTDTWGFLIMIMVSIIFGGIHCIAWGFAFPTLAERWAWRATAVIVSALPLSISALSVIIASVDDEAPDAGTTTKVAQSLLVIVAMSSTILYILARLVLLVLPLISLRSLPSGAYIDIQWTAFLPHFSS